MATPFGLEGRPMERLKDAAGARVGHEQLDENRFRHPATFLRRRQDRTSKSCTFAQLTG